MLVIFTSAVPYVSTSEASKSTIWMLTPIYPADIPHPLCFGSVRSDTVEEVKGAEGEESKGHALGVIAGVCRGKKCFQATEVVADMCGLVKLRRHQRRSSGVVGKCRESGKML